MSPGKGGGNARRGIFVPLLVASFAGPLTAQSTWSEISEFASRSNHGTSFDPVTGKVVIVGGFDGSAFDDTWTWDGVELVEVQPATRPPSGTWATTYDSLRARTIGVVQTSNGRQTWSFDGSTWSQVATTAQPQGQYGVTLTYDPTRDRVVAWAGTSPSSADVWEFDGSDWSRITVTLPVPRFSLSHPSIVYDPDSDSCVVFQAIFDSGLWHWDGVNWTRDAGPSFSGGAPKMVHDPVAHRLLLVGGRSGDPTLHEWSTVTNRWLPLSSGGPETSGHGVWFDPTRNVLGIVGGRAVGTEVDSSIWEWDGTDWSRRSYGAPGARQEPLLAYDPARDRTFLCGEEFSTFDLWVREQGNWRLLVPHSLAAPSSTWPGSPTGGRIVYDQTNDELLLVGGDNHSASDFLFYRISQGQWQQVVTANAPRERRDAAVCFDSRRGRVLLFGGFPNSGGYNALGDMWAYDGTDWVELTPPVLPPPGHRQAMVYDERRDRVVLAGPGATGPQDHTWEFDGTTWQLVDTGCPLGIRPLATSYDRSREAVVAYVRRDSPGFVDETWQWDGRLWRRTAIASTPQDRGNPSLVGRRDDVLLFGGMLSSEPVTAPMSLTVDAPASAEPFGDAGTSTAGPLELVSTGPRPWLGTNVELQLSTLPPFTLPALWMGLSRTTWSGVPLPVDLASIGYAGRLVRISVDGPWPIVDQLDGTAEAELTVPWSTALVGAAVHLQALTFEPLTGALTTSNALTLNIGNR